ncbi:MAG: branched-subunit amino acid transport protein AzlD, partial [Planctomycetota bacterium]
MSNSASGVGRSLKRRLVLSVALGSILFLFVTAFLRSS